MANAQAPLDTIRAQYQKCLALDADDAVVVDYIFSILTATYHPLLIEPVWGWLIAPPGAGKTEVLRPLADYPDCVFISAPTENALMSGFSDEAGRDPSLITLLDKKVLIIKDFTPIASGEPKKTAKILGDFRDAFDGFCAKPSGTSGLRDYRARFGIVAAVTDEIDNFSAQYQQLGERFLALRIKRSHMTIDQRLLYLGHVHHAMTGKTGWQAELATLVNDTLTEIRGRFASSDTLPSIPPEVLSQILATADVIGTMRTTPIRGNATEPEIASRLVQQLINLGLAHAIVSNRDRWDHSDTAFCLRVATDTLPVQRRRLILCLYRRASLTNPGLSVAQMGHLCPGISIPLISDLMTQYLHNKVIVRSSPAGAEPLLYHLSPDFYRHLRTSGLLEQGQHLPHTDRIVDKDTASPYNDMEGEPNKEGEP